MRVSATASQMNLLGRRRGRGDKISCNRRFVVWKIGGVGRSHGRADRGGVARNTTEILNFQVLGVRRRHSRGDVIMVDLIGQAVLRAARTLRVGVRWVEIKVIRRAGGTAVPRIDFRGIIVAAGVRGMTGRAGMKPCQSTVQGLR